MARDAGIKHDNAKSALGPGKHRQQLDAWCLRIVSTPRQLIGAGIAGSGVAGNPKVFVLFHHKAIMVSGPVNSKWNMYARKAASIQRLAAIK